MECKCAGRLFSLRRHGHCKDALSQEEDLNVNAKKINMEPQNGSWVEGSGFLGPNSSGSVPNTKYDEFIQNSAVPLVP